MNDVLTPKANDVQLGAETAEVCGSCRYAQTIKEDLNMIECHGAPPSVVVMGMTPQRQPAMGVFWPRLARSFHACALHRRKGQIIPAR
jgi:hypothetical protein